MDCDPKDNVLTIASIALVAYVATDIAHHVLGHGAACLLEGGHVHLLSSIVVVCSMTGSAIDLAGPMANLVLGLIAAQGTHFRARQSAATRLFFIMLAAFNLLWFELQLVFSAVSQTDDWAWPIQEWQVAEPLRYGMITIGMLVYVLTLRFIGSELAAFARPLSRSRIIVGTMWLTAGAIACGTAALDHHPAKAILQHALPQSLLLSIGILLVPGKAARSSSGVPAQTALGLSRPWVIAASIVGLVSVVCLGPGFAVG